MAEKIAFLIIGALVIFTFILCFWLNFYLGLFMLIFSICVIWWIYGVRKKKIDKVLADVAKDIGLSCNKSLLKYASLRGKYKGFETEIGIYNDIDAFGGLGTILASITGSGSMATLNIRNFTGIRIKHNLHFKKSKVISETFPKIIAHGNEIFLIFPNISDKKEEIKKHLENLINILRDLSNESMK
ncbi:hypothetical protein NLD30_07280 [SCandidatus Aminicenantes bacterium Aminicenantia_JdfR_composite]|jgi:cbb3-type cytochrome oxidase subunit 3|nr:hypothetical protein [SCandidatus Aminicenantes bacterium Aminicenantia_JdfR_composite]